MSELGKLEYLVVLDDDPLVSKIIGSAVAKDTRNYENLESFKSDIENLDPVAIFVDIHLGLRDNGLEILPDLKSRWPFCPIIVVTGDKNEDTVGDALAAGADDFVHKPINTKELLARLQARLGELAKREAREVLHLGDVTVDVAHRVISNQNGESRYLSPTEMSLLLCLLEAQGTVVRRDTMKRKCWGQIYVSDNALNRKLHEVRRSLKEISMQVSIRTLYGTGFVMEVKAPFEVKKGA